MKIPKQLCLSLTLLAASLPCLHAQQDVVVAVDPTIAQPAVPEDDHGEILSSPETTIVEVVGGAPPPEVHGEVHIGGSGFGSAPLILEAGRTNVAPAPPANQPPVLPQPPVMMYKSAPGSAAPQVFGNTLYTQVTPTTTWASSAPQGNAYGVTAQEPRAEKIIRDVKLKVFQRHYESALSESVELERALLDAPADKKEAMTARLAALQGFTSKLEGGIHSLAVPAPGPAPVRAEFRTAPAARLEIHDNKIHGMEAIPRAGAAPAMRAVPATPSIRVRRFSAPAGVPGTPVAPGPELPALPPVPGVPGVAAPVEVPPLPQPPEVPEPITPEPAKPLPPEPKSTPLPEGAGEPPQGR